ncbi:MAG: hypothetical protein RLO18_20495, partial [Gimesia chilikensis]
LLLAPWKVLQARRWSREANLETWEEDFIKKSIRRAKRFWVGSVALYVLVGVAAWLWVQRDIEAEARIAVVQSMVESDPRESLINAYHAFDLTETDFALGVLRAALAWAIPERTTELRQLSLDISYDGGWVAVQGNLGRVPKVALYDSCEWEKKLEVPNVTHAAFAPGSPRIALAKVSPESDESSLT